MQVDAAMTSSMTMPGIAIKARCVVCRVSLVVMITIATMTAMSSTMYVINLISRAK